MAKITLATLKSFLKKNEGNLYVIEHSRFDGMSDMVETNLNAQMHKVDAKFNAEYTHTFGIDGIWVVRGSRDWFSERKLEKADGSVYEGIHCWNCCGEWTVYKKVK